MVAAKYVLPRKYPGLQRAYKAPGWAPVLGAAGAAAVICLALVPGTNMSLVWPGEYIVLLAWFALGAVLLSVAGRMDRDAALTELLGDYRHQLAQAQEPQSGQDGSARASEGVNGRGLRDGI